MGAVLATVTAQPAAASTAYGPSTGGSSSSNNSSLTPTAASQKPAALPASPVPPFSNYVPRVHDQSISMKPGTLDLSATADASLLASDGRLELTVPAGAVSAADVASAGGHARLVVRQIAPASGGNAGASGHYSFGTFLIQLVDASGKLRKQALHKPLRLSMHYSQREQAVDLAHTVVVFNSAPPLGVELNPQAAGPTLTTSQAALGQPTSTRATLDQQAQTLTASASATTASTTVGFNTNSAVAAFGKPDPF